MASPTRRLARALGAILAGIVLAVLLFALGGWIGSSIPRNSGWTQPADGVEILVESNGVHTGLVLPLVTAEKDWRTEFPASELALPGRDYTHVSISWGEREVFLNTPTWWDLRPMTVLRIIGVGGDGLIHVAHYVRPAPSDGERPLLLSHAEYRRLVVAIEQSLPRGPHRVYAGYGPSDVFYDAPGHYTSTNTCNQWTSDTLARAGVKTGWWTPFAGGVMKWVPEPRGIG
ncbi:MAG: TIGR02117 family protein [Croceibacterium sp.]